MNVNDILNDVAAAIELEKGTYTATELFNLNTEAIPYLVEPIIPKVGIFSIVGSSDTGKSMLFRQLALSIARQNDFLGFNVKTLHSRVLFIATEDDNVSTGFLLRKQAANVSSLDNIRFHFETDSIPDYLEDQLSIEPVDLIIIDAWSDVFGQNLNDSALIRAALNIYRSISTKHQCAIGFLHHTGKRTQKLLPSKDNILSGQGFEAKMRLVMELRSDGYDNDYKHLCIVKGNYLGKEYKNSSYKLHLNPDTFLFTNTGERVLFEDLAEPSEDKSNYPKVTQPYDIADEIHKRFMLDIFIKKDEAILSKDLLENIILVYGKELKQKISRDTSRLYLQHLEKEQIITQVGTKGTKSSAYKYLR